MPKDVATDGEEGLALGLTRVHDLIILDIRLPKMDGLRVLQALRYDRVTAPVHLTVRATIEDKVLGLDAGADDYLTKLFRLSGTGGAGCAPCCDGARKGSRRSCASVI